jgi:hypothetical protein
MAEAAGHKWGQFIGEYCETQIELIFKKIARDNNLYLDKKGPRSARSGKKVTWQDAYGNSHDLDFVMERNGADDKIGSPVAFIESAWRRYTKHSKNKVQEIQGAVLPIADKHRNSAPFLGCFLIGEYTKSALTQLETMGFKILYFPYDSVIRAFQAVGIDAHFDESTTEFEHIGKLDSWKALSQQKKDLVWKELLKQNEKNIKDFSAEIEKSINRSVVAVTITPLHGLTNSLETITAAITFIKNYIEPTKKSMPLMRYEIRVKYCNGDKIEGQFQEKESAVTFLECYLGNKWEIQR